MPIDILLCEGVQGSPDIRLLNAILHGTVREIRPAGGKRELPRVREIRRDVNPNLSIRCLRDCDFDHPPDTVTNLPQNWEYQGQQIGWKWERKEVENYLIDPGVVQRALMWTNEQSNQYQHILRESARTICAYTAARVTLSSFRRVELLPNSWGEESDGLRGHSLPSDRSEQICRTSVESIIRGKGIRESVLPDQAVVRFNDFMLHYCHNGYRAQNFLTYYAGKDLLGAMNLALVNAFGMNPGAFLERLLRAIERAPDPWTWLPEWTELRRVIQSV